MSSARADIFARVRHASRCAGAQEIASELASLGRAPAASARHENLCVTFLANVLANHGTIDIAGDRSAAVKAVSAYLYEHYRSQRLVAGNDPHLAALPWRDAGLLPRFGAVEAGEPVALSYARVAVAELGGIVTFTGKNNPAANNLLAERHVVLVDAADLVADMEAAWQRIEQLISADERPRGINFIAGPSSTADIEGQLVYGAHGPLAWHVILIGDVPVDARAEAERIAAD